MEIEEGVELGTLLFSARWFTLKGEGARKETGDLGDVWGVLRELILALEFILALGRTARDGEGNLLGDGGRLETFGRGETPFTLRGDCGRSRSGLAVTCGKVELVEKLGRVEELRTDFRLYGCHEPWSQWIATPEPSRAIVVGG